MFRRISRILCIVFLVLSVICFGLLILSFFPGNSFRLSDVINTSRTEYRLIAVFGAAALIGYACVFVVSVAFRQFGKKWMQTAGKLLSLLCAALALCISFTAVTLLLSPQKGISVDYEYDSSAYSSYKYSGKPPSGAVLSPGTLAAEVVSFFNDEPNGRTKVKANLYLYDVNLDRVTYVSLRCIACDADGTSFGAFYLPLKERFFSSGMGTMVTCTFPLLPDSGVSMIYELLYYDGNGVLNYCCSSDINITVE